MRAEYSKTMFICVDNVRYIVDYVMDNGHHTYSMVDAKSKDEARKFILNQPHVKRITRVYKP